MAENFLEELTSDYRIPLTPGINIKKTTFRHIIKKLTISEEKNTLFSVVSIQTLEARK